MLPQQVLEMRNQWRVGRQHGIGSQILRPHPFQRLPVERLNQALPAAADVERHQQMKILIRMTGEGERREAVRFDRNAKLFPEFADERVLRPFARVHLPAGELPQAFEGFAFGPLREQYASVGVDQRRRDDEHQPHER
jgi:hypothetical protein